jgi:hypothetical protein
MGVLTLVWLLDTPTHVWYTYIMARTTTRRVSNPPDPQDVSVQISFRVPFFYREQLIDEANNLRVSLPNLIVDAVERVYPPKRP